MNGIGETDPSTRTRGLAALSCGALALLTGVAVAALGRLFTTGTWWPAAVAVAVTGHATSYAARRIRLGALLSITLSLVSVALLSVWCTLGSTTVAGLPTMRTFTDAADAIGAAASKLGHAGFPVPLRPGYQLLGLLAIGCASILADVLAFRAGLAMWAALPGLLLVCTAVALAPPGTVYAWTIVFVGAVQVFWLVHSVEFRAGTPVRFVGSTAPSRPISTSGVLFTTVCVVAAVTIAPLLPRDEAAAAMAPRSAPTPLLGIHPLLSRDAQVEQFTVDSAVGLYWRLTALDTYDGDTWQANAPYQVGDGRLPSSWPHAEGRSIDQTFTIGRLSSLWLPGAYRAVKVEGQGKVGWDRASESLISPSTGSNGFRYRVESVVPQLTVDQMRSADPLDVPKDDRDRYTALPPMPEDVFTLSRDITFAPTTVFDKALALQTYLRSKYTFADVPPGHSVAALRQFLFTSRQGTSEQFAAAFAVLARAADLPTRVAVGFKPGKRFIDSLWHVNGADAHAWPEVLLGTYGWVPFDPTPGPGVIGATGDLQVGKQNPDTPLPAQAGESAGLFPTAADLRGAADPSPPPPTTIPPHRSRDHASPSRWPLLVELAPLAIGLAWLAFVPALGALRRRRRRRSARTESDAVLVAFAETAERLADAGCPLQLSDTVVEHAHRAARGGHLSEPRAHDLHALARHAAAALYSTASSDVGDARSRADRIQREVLTSAPSWRRAAWALDPRRPTPAGRTWRPGRERPRARSTVPPRR